MSDSLIDDAVGYAVLQFVVHDRRRISRLIWNALSLRRVLVPSGQKAAPAKVISADSEVANIGRGEEFHSESSCLT